LNPFNQFNHQIKLRLAHGSIEYVKAFFIKLSSKEGDMASIICTCKSTIRGTTPRIVYGRVTII
jgi:hypothetical protein